MHELAEIPITYTIFNGYLLKGTFYTCPVGSKNEILGYVTKYSKTNIVDTLKEWNSKINKILEIIYDDRDDIKDIIELKDNDVKFYLNNLFI